MKRKDEHLYVKRALRRLTEVTSACEKEIIKNELIHLMKADYPLVMSMIKNGYFFDKEGAYIEHDRLIDVIDSNLSGYSLPDYTKTMTLIKEHQF